MNKIILIIIYMLVTDVAFAQKNNKSITVAFYNCENFFDYTDDPKINDEEYLPNAPLKWDDKKYLNKINKIAQVFDSTVIGAELPSIMGLCEIENNGVLKDLIAKSLLVGKGYESVATAGRDKRGINVGLLYNTNIFKLESTEELDATGSYEQLTRNILYVKLRATNNDILYVFVNHWPSRREGEKESEPRRVYAAQILRNKINEITKVDANAKCIIMGDFNDHPDNISIQNTLQAVDKPKQKTNLYNPFFLLDKKGQGTHVHENKWRVLDQIIVSQGLLKTKKGYFFNKNQAYILKKDFVLFKNKTTGEEKPNRTYGSNNKYYDGYSDHLSVYIQLTEK